MITLKELRPLSPSSFFEVQAQVPKISKKKGFKEGTLPDTTGLMGEGKLISFALLWSPHALHFQISSYLPMEEGDLINLFIDTRDLKNSNVITRFCHHFILYLDEETGIEVTRFRGEDRHELADPLLINIKTEVKRSSYQAEGAFPKEILYGYDPEECPKIGFSYCFKKKNGERQHFNLSSNFFNLEKYPALWASLDLQD